MTEILIFQETYVHNVKLYQTMTCLFCESEDETAEPLTPSIPLEEVCKRKPKQILAFDKILGFLFLNFDLSEILVFKVQTKNRK